MSSWIVKAVLQHFIGLLPRSYWWNILFQKHVTKGYYPSRESFEYKLVCCGQHLDHYRKFSPAPSAEFNALELGPGAWPIVPIGLYLCGASKIWTYDVVPLLRRDTLRRTIELFGEFHRDGALERILGAVERKRLLHLEELLSEIETATPADLLRSLDIHVHVGDARATVLPNHSVDLIFSTVVLEMIGPEVLIGLFAEFRRVASPHAVMSHYVGLGDQYASFDKSITPYNFLKYSDRQWRILNNPIIPHSRLRLPDYREIFREAGWDIVEERNSKGSLDDFNKIRLAPKFLRYPSEDLLALTSWFVARPFIRNA